MSEAIERRRLSREKKEKRLVDFASSVGKVKVGAHQKWAESSERREDKTKEKVLPDGRSNAVESP